MKKMSIIQLALTLLFSVLVLAMSDIYAALSMLLGCLTIFLSFISWGISMSMIFRKKFIALSLCIIVFKYAILGIIIYWVVRQGWMQLIWFILGIASFAITSLTYAILESLKEGKEDVI